jgi:hypothetical protein
MNYELVGQADFGCHRTGVRTKSPLNQVPPKHTHHTLNSSFLHIFQILLPSVIFLGSLWPTSTIELDMPGLQSHSNMDPLSQDASKAAITESNRNICFTSISSLASAAQVTFETQN